MITVREARCINILFVAHEKKTQHMDPHRKHSSVVQDKFIHRLKMAPCAETCSDTVHPNELGYAQWNMSELFGCA
jgi:hypothetical protein